MAELTDRDRRSFEAVRVVGDDDHKEWCLLSHDILPIDALLQFVRTPSAGAISSFLGTTRDTFEDKTVTHLEYEAYHEMALSTLEALCNQIRSKWSVHSIAIAHKLGSCPVSEVSVAIYISAAHRIDSLQAVEFGINELKRTLPVWKKEYYSDGEANWKMNEKQPHDA